MLAQDPDARLTIPLRGFLPGPKDMLDAIVAAFTVREYLLGRGYAAGGGDGLGTIVLPRGIDAVKAGEVVNWPER